MYANHQIPRVHPGYSINLLEIKEVRRQTEIGRIAIQSAVEMAYDKVPSLRKIIKVKPKEVRLINRTSSQRQSVAVTFDEPSTTRLREERTQITEALESLVAPGGSFCWLEKTPHLTIMDLGINTPAYVVGDFMNAIEESLPSNMTAQRATIHNPVKR